MEILLLIRKLSHNLMLCASVGEHLGTPTFLCTAVLLIYFVKPRPEFLSCVSRDCHEILIIMCLERGKKSGLKIKSIAIEYGPRQSPTGVFHTAVI